MLGKYLKHRKPLSVLHHEAFVEEKWPIVTKEIRATILKEGKIFCNTIDEVELNNNRLINYSLLGVVDIRKVLTKEENF